MIEPMAFPDSILTDGETIVRQFRPHWRMLAIPVLWFLAAIVAIGLVYGALPPDDGTADLITTGVIVLAMLALVVGPVLKWWFTLYALTTERLITRTGIIARRGIEIPLQNINNVLFNQNILERVLQSGDLLIESAGESGQSKFSDIPNPEEFQSLLYRTREEQHRKTAAEESAIAADLGRDPTEQLERAARLHQRGVLSDEEFEAMKRTILGNIE
jgi:uncharacterized membrane protein YdbT with pleckstrin-like domain